MQSMTRADLAADNVAKTSGLARADAEVVVQTVLDRYCQVESRSARMAGWNYCTRVIGSHVK